VAAPFRRQGVARALIAQVEVAARAAGASEVVIITGFDNEGAHVAHAGKLTVPCGSCYRRFWRAHVLVAVDAMNRSHREGATPQRMRV
jgi:GNAT superfamily N-acetyltransferase